MRHFRGAWTNGANVACCNYAKEEVGEDLKDAYRRLRVMVDVKLIIISIDEEFNLSSYYHKGDGDAFKTFMEEHYPKT